ncbi:MAG TPA: autorepressor SdpR family transcription factor [Polyangiales bacterium]|jgi:DNA-binding transcriptional ArsR family regulator|nr:autorepressor SdpR family transcription factor [Polyangiales bacterium]
MDEIWKALADPTRRRILELLRARDLSAGEVAAHFELSKPTLSGHFAVLKHAGLIAGERQGTTIVYRLNVTLIEEALWHLMNAMNVNPAAARSTKTRARAARGTRRSRSSS